MPEAAPQPSSAANSAAVSSFAACLERLQGVVSARHSWALWVAALAASPQDDPAAVAAASAKLRRMARSRGGARGAVALPLGALFASSEPLEDRAAAWLDARTVLRQNGGGSGVPAWVGAAAAPSGGKLGQDWAGRVGDLRVRLRTGDRRFRRFLKTPVWAVLAARPGFDLAAVAEAAGAWDLVLERESGLPSDNRAMGAIWMAARGGPPSAALVDEWRVFAASLEPDWPAAAPADREWLATLMFAPGEGVARRARFAAIVELAQNWPRRPKAPLDREILALLAVVEIEGETLRPLVGAFCLARFAGAESERRLALIEVAGAVLIALLWSLS